MKMNLLSLDLQFFSEGEEVDSGGIESSTAEVVKGGYDPDAEIEFNPETENPLDSEEGEFTTTEEADPNQVQDENAQPDEQPNQQQQAEFLDFGGRKVDPNDPEAVRQAHEDFQEAQRYINELANYNKQLMQQQQQLTQQMQDPQQFQAQQQQQQEPQKSQEEINEELMERFYENPKEFFDEMRENLKNEAYELARQEYEPYIKEQRYQSEINGLMNKHGEEFTNHIPQMQEIIQNMGQEQAENFGLENVYYMARGMNGQQQQAPSPDQLAQDPDFIQNYILNNENVKQQILQDYMSQKQQAPKTMGNNQGGMQNFSAPNKPKSISEAGKLFQKSLDQGL